MEKKVYHRGRYLTKKYIIITITGFVIFLIHKKQIQKQSFDVCAGLHTCVGLHVPCRALDVVGDDRPSCIYDNDAHFRTTAIISDTYSLSTSMHPRCKIWLDRHKDRHRRRKRERINLCSVRVDFQVDVIGRRLNDVWVWHRVVWHLAPSPIHVCAINWGNGMGIRIIEVSWKREKRNSLMERKVVKILIDLHEEKWL